MRDEVPQTTQGGRLIDQLVQATLKAVDPKSTFKQRQRMAGARTTLEEYVSRLEKGKRRPKGYTVVEVNGRFIAKSTMVALGAGKYLGSRSTRAEAERCGREMVVKLRKEMTW